jgi:hypothetical protein
MDQEGTKRLQLVQTGSDRLTQVLKATPETLYGSVTPRVAYAWARVNRLLQFNRIPFDAVARMAGD